MNKKLKTLLLTSIMGINFGLCSAWPWNKEFEPRQFENPKDQFVYDELLKNSGEINFKDPLFFKLIESKTFHLAYFPAMTAFLAKMCQNATGPGANFLKNHTPTTTKAALIGLGIGSVLAAFLKIFADFDTMFRLDSVNFMKNWKDGNHYEKQTPEELHPIFDEILEIKKQADKTEEKNQNKYIRMIVKRMDKAKKEIESYLAKSPKLKNA